MVKVQNGRLSLGTVLRNKFYNAGYMYPRSLMMQHIWSVLYDKLPRLGRFGTMQWEELL